MKGLEFVKLIQLTWAQNEPHHKKEHIKISKLVKFEDVWLDINIVCAFKYGKNKRVCMGLSESVPCNHTLTVI
jgi:hypothetical protein